MSHENKNSVRDENRQIDLSFFYIVRKIANELRKSEMRMRGERQIFIYIYIKERERERRYSRRNVTRARRGRTSHPSSPSSMRSLAARTHASSPSLARSELRAPCLLGVNALREREGDSRECRVRRYASLRFQQRKAILAGSRARPADDDAASRLRIHTHTHTHIGRATQAADIRRRATRRAPAGRPAGFSQLCSLSRARLDLYARV